MLFESFLTFLLNNQKNHEIRAESYPIAYKAKQKSKLEPITYKVKEKQHSKFKELGSVCFTENDFQKNIFRKMTYGKIFYRKKRKKRVIKIRKMFSPFQIRKIFYRKMALFSVDQKNIFS